MWRLSGEVRGSEFEGENPEHLAKLDEKYYRPFGAKLRRAPKGRKGYQGRVERSHRMDDEEFFLPVVGEEEDGGRFSEGCTKVAASLQRGAATFWVGMNGKSPLEKLQELGWGLPDEFACFPVILLDEVAVIWASMGDHHVLAYYKP